MTTLPDDDNNLLHNARGEQEQFDHVSHLLLAAAFEQVRLSQKKFGIV